MTKRNVKMVTFASEWSKFRDCPEISDQCTITLRFAHFFRNEHPCWVPICLFDPNKRGGGFCRLN